MMDCARTRRTHAERFAHRINPAIEFLNNLVDDGRQSCAAFGHMEVRPQVDHDRPPIVYHALLPLPRIHFQAPGLRGHRVIHQNELTSVCIWSRKRGIQSLTGPHGVSLAHKAPTPRRHRVLAAPHSGVWPSATMLLGTDSMTRRLEHLA